MRSWNGFPNPPTPPKPNEKPKPTKPKPGWGNSKGRLTRRPCFMSHALGRVMRYLSAIESYSLEFLHSCSLVRIFAPP